MRRIFLLVTIIFFSNLTINAQKIYSCKSYNNADIIAYVTGFKNQADVIVYKCYSEKELNGNSARWFFVTDEKDADFKIYFDEYKTDAKLFIYYTNNKKYAAWRNYSKKRLLNHK